MRSHNAVRVLKKPHIWLIFGALISGGEELLWVSKLDANGDAAKKQEAAYNKKLSGAKYNKQLGTDLTKLDE